MSQVAERPAGAHARPSNAAPTQELAASLQRLVRQNGRRWKCVILLEALALAVAAPLAYLWLAFSLDMWLHLSVAGRLLALMGVVAGVAWALTFLVRRWHNLRLTEDQVALAMERRTGKVENRLINAVQIARFAHQEHPILSEAVVQENCEHLQKIHLERAAQFKSALVRLALAAVVIAAGLTFWLLKPAQFANAAARIFLPLADIEPFYHTRLVVKPGNIEGHGDMPIWITVQGERPRTLTILKTQDGRESTATVDLVAHEARIPASTVGFIAAALAQGPAAAASALVPLPTHIFPNVSQSMEYAVRGGDYTSPYYRIDVPRKFGFNKLRVTYAYPEYTGLPEKVVEGTGGELEGLPGTRAQLHFFFDHPLDQVDLSLERSGSKKRVTDIQPLKQLSPREFTGQVVIDQHQSYCLEMTQAERPKQTSASLNIRILKDQEPKLEIIGMERRMELQIDSVLPLKLTASDDFGLEKVGLFYRRAVIRDEKIKPADEGWESTNIWPGNKKATFQQSHELAIASLQIAEGEKIELALRAVDTDPLKKGDWTTGPIHELTIGGDGVALQVLYEQIIRSEGELKALIGGEQAVLSRIVEWLRKLDGDGELRWDDPKNIDALHTAVREIITEQDRLRKSASLTARSMVVQTGNMRIAVSMLADTEMDRPRRILDAVPERPQAPAKRSAVADARVTQERIVRSLEDILENYVSFRADWEMNNMIPFAKMLAERQTKMRDQSRRCAGQGPGKAEDFLRQSMGRRQGKVQDLCQLIQPAFTGLGEKLKELEADLAKAFQAGAATLGSDSLKQPMRQAAEDAKAGRWNEAAQNQTVAADMLHALHDQLRKAQLEAAQKALAALKEKAKTDLEAQKELEKLDPGSSEAFVKNYPENFKVEDLMRLREVAGAKKRIDKKEDQPDYKDSFVLDVDKKDIERETDSGVRQDPYTLTLGKIAEKTPKLKMYKDKENNAVRPFIQEKFDDLVGKLLEETEEMHKDYQKIKLSTNQNNNDPGDIGKVGGALNSTGAVTATGNKKPPTTESGGVARTGRQGARAYGMVADDEGHDRRGRDKAQEGQEKVADQPGTIKMHKTEDPQKDLSTGVGGKKVESDDNHFSLHDAGKWKDEMTSRMDKPQKKNYIVERQGDPIDAKTAAQLRDLTSKQEQVIERLKSIKKELKNLYLPTDHLDELAAALEANLENLKDRPEAELFRLQVQTLERLRGTMRVFQNANASLEPSLPRDRALRGRVLDEPVGQALPGYEEAVRQYYLNLANQ